MNLDERLTQEFRDILYRVYLASDEGRCINEKGQANPTTKDGTPIRKLFVSNLAERTTYKDLAKLFSTYGKVESCYLKRNRGSTNYAFVTFSTVEDAIKARQDSIETKITLHYRDLRVVPAHSWHQPENNFFNQHIAVDYVRTNNSDTKIDILDDDCLAHIFLYLPIADRVKVERVCKRWRTVSRQSWHSVKVLDLSKTKWNLAHRYGIDNAMVRKVLLRCGKFLNEIYLTPYLVDLDRSILSDIGKLCPNLRTLDATGVTISHSSIARLATNCHNITKLSLGSIVSKIVDQDLVKLFKANQHLQYLKLHNVSMDDEYLLCLLPESLEKLFLHSCYVRDRAKLFEAIARFKNLETLSLRSTLHPNDNEIERLSVHCKKLRKLEISHYVIPDYPVFRGVYQLQNLEYLILREARKFSNEFIVNLSTTCKKLKYLDLSECDLEDDDVDTLTNLPQLEVLMLNYNSSWPHERLAKRATLEKFSKLTRLECQGSLCLTNEDLIYLVAHLPQLEVLNVVQCQALTDKVLSTILAITRTRQKSVLKLFVGGSHRMLLDAISDQVSPLLHVVNITSSVSTHYLRFLPDINPLFEEL